MRIAKALALAIALCAGAAVAGIALSPSSQFTFTACSSSGSAAQNVPAGNYLLSVLNEPVWICQASTCASPNGVVLPAPTLMLYTVTGSPGTTSSISCRSTGSTGNLQLTQAAAP